MDARNAGRRKALECMVWAGAGVLWTVSGGVPRSALVSAARAADAKPVPAGGGFSFVQSGRRRGSGRRARRRP